jgi:hypothetical protein
MTDTIKRDMAIAIAADLLGIGADGADVTLDDMSRVSDVVRDSVLEEPTTDIGRTLKDKLAEEIQLGESSKYYQVEFDFNTHLNNVALPVILAILPLLNNAKTIEIFGASSEEMEETMKERDAVAFQVLQLLKDNVPLSYYGEVFSRIKTMLESVEGFVQSQVNGHRGEIQSRLFGARNPKYKRFDQGHATYQNILDTLEKVRQETGNDPKDYFSN